MYWPSSSDANYAVSVLEWTQWHQRNIRQLKCGHRDTHKYHTQTRARWHDILLLYPATRNHDVESKINLISGGVVWNWFSKCSGSHGRGKTSSWPGGLSSLGNSLTANQRPGLPGFWPIRIPNCLTPDHGMSPGSAGAPGPASCGASDGIVSWAKKFVIIDQ